jgi:hypothetical protein
MAHKNPHAVALGRLGGLAGKGRTSPAKAAAARENSKKAHRPMPERFWEKVKKDGPIPERFPELGPCWLWTAGTYQGYGAFIVSGRSQRAHRVAWYLANGPIPLRKYVLHRCDIRPCVNPGHLFLGDHAANMADMITKGRQRGAIGDRNVMISHPERAARGERQGNAKLTSDKVLMIRTLYTNGGITQHGLAKQFGVSRPLIKRIVRGEIWRHLISPPKA